MKTITSPKPTTCQATESGLLARSSRFTLVFRVYRLGSIAALDDSQQRSTDWVAPHWTLMGIPPRREMESSEQRAQCTGPQATYPTASDCLRIEYLPFLLNDTAIPRLNSSISEHVAQTQAGLDRAWGFYSSVCRILGSLPRRCALATSGNHTTEEDRILHPGSQNGNYTLWWLGKGWKRHGAWLAVACAARLDSLRATACSHCWPAAVPV